MGVVTGESRGSIRVEMDEDEKDLRMRERTDANGDSRTTWVPFTSPWEIHYILLERLKSKGEETYERYNRVRYIDCASARREGLRSYG
jgi:hypothetical protein